MTILDYFPFPKMRESQRRVLLEIDDALKSGYTQIVLEASTGFGKSPVAIAVANYLRTSYICTSTINLQDQYLRDFESVKKVIGKNNFECQVEIERDRAGMFKCERCETLNYKECKHTTVDKAMCRNKKFICPYATNRGDYNTDGESIELRKELLQLQQDPNSVNTLDISTNLQEKISRFLGWDHYLDLRNNWSPCSYYHQKNIGLLSPHTIFNYAIFNKMDQVKKKWGKPYLEKKGLLILDEGHLFEEEVIKYNGEELELGTIMNLTNNRIKQMPVNATFDEWVQFLRSVIEYTDLKIDDLKQEQEQLKKNKPSLNNQQIKRLRNLPDFIDYAEEKREKLFSLSEEMDSDPDNWIIDPTISKLIIKPLDISSYCRELYQNGERLLVMSATILDKDLYCRQIGLDPNEIKFISVDSEFPVENRPIFTPYMGKLSKDNVNLPAIHKVIGNNINKIFSEYKNQRGLIHMPTNKLIDQIIPYIEDRKRLYIIKSMTAKERKSALEAFEADPRGVLMSPSLYVGIDLKDDLSRFQIIVKVPYPSLGDKWIKKKFDQNKKWYSWQTTLKVIQGYGRSVRSSEDYADTYILDQNFDNILKFSSNILPKSFKDAIAYGKKNPDAKIGNKIRVEEK